MLSLHTAHGPGLKNPLSLCAAWESGLYVMALPFSFESALEILKCLPEPAVGYGVRVNAAEL